MMETSFAATLEARPSYRDVAWSSLSPREFAKFDRVSLRVTWNIFARDRVSLQIIWPECVWLLAHSTGSVRKVLLLLWTCKMLTLLCVDLHEVWSELSWPVFFSSLLHHANLVAKSCSRSGLGICGHLFALVCCVAVVLSLGLVGVGVCLGWFLVGRLVVRCNVSRSVLVSTATDNHISLHVMPYWWSNLLG